MAEENEMQLQDMDALDQLMPMNLHVSETGHITHAGPTVQKIFGDTSLEGMRFLEVFEVRRPGSVNSVTALQKATGRVLHLTFRHDPAGRFKALAVGAGDGNNLIINMSFGISVIEAVQNYNLTSADFEPTNLAVEMLFLVEAKTAVLDELRQLNGRLEGARVVAEAQATTDMLTGLGNRRGMDLKLAELMERNERFGLMHIDLDYFKDVNDTLGHAAGDHVLKIVAKILRDETREGDMVARAGGDEFVLLFPRLTNTERLNDIAHRIIAKLEQPIEFEGETCRISGSVGTTVSDFYKAPTAERMLADADVALYASKHKGRAQATVWSEHLAAATQAEMANAPPSRETRH
ncbi:diguanylate cyclase [Thalassobius sp. I31.1]|uniref:diguanylate cyclase domain-containing protein n=1 Tax=Thalassobius sp. I31.1 TaxID=2109912 RepID=UPI002570E076|nr:diguanylate cyclase [Thalassobius sp. I31.1]